MKSQAADIRRNDDPAFLGVRARKELIRAQLSENFGYYLSKAKMSQKDLVEAVNAASKDDREFKEIKEWELSRYARGLITPDAARLEQIAQALNVSPFDLAPAYAKPNAAKGSTMTVETVGAGKVRVTFDAVVDAPIAAELMTVISKQVG